MPRTTVTRRRSALTPILPTPFLPSPRFPSLLSPMQDLTARANRMIRAAFAGLPALPPMEWFPVVNVTESADEFTLTAELPGLSANDVTIDFCDNVLTISGEKKDEHETAEGDDRRWYLWERRFGSFQRAVPFPGGIAEDRIGAEFREGVLTVHLPKLEAKKAKHHAIAVTEG